MNTQNYSNFSTGRRKKTKKIITTIIIIAIIILAAAFAIGKLTENSAEYQLHASTIEENRMLREQAAELQERINELEKQLAQKDAYIGSLPTEAPTDEPAADDEENAGAAPEEEEGTTPRNISRD